MSNRKNPVHFTIDFTKKQIRGTKTSLEKASRCGSPEYKELCELMKAHPQFKVVSKSIKQKTSKQTYKKLNFTFIEKYISIQPNVDELMQEYEHVKVTASSLGMSVYPYIKKWFLKKFGGESKSFDMDKAIEEINTFKPAAVQVPDPAAAQPQDQATAQIMESATTQAMAAAQIKELLASQTEAAA